MERPRIHAYLFELFPEGTPIPRGCSVEDVFSFGIMVTQFEEDGWDVRPHGLVAPAPVDPLNLGSSLPKDVAFELARTARDEWLRGVGIRSIRGTMTKWEVAEMYVRKVPTIMYRQEQMTLDVAFDKELKSDQDSTDPQRRVPFWPVGGTDLNTAQSGHRPGPLGSYV